MATLAGKALYMELRRGGSTTQALFVPQVTNPMNSQTQKAKGITRQISEAKQRASWRYMTSDSVAILEPTNELPRALANVVPFLEEIGSYVCGLADGQWKIVGTPVVVEMSAEDVNDVWEAKTPNALIRRALRARAEAGYPAELFTTSSSLPSF